MPRYVTEIRKDRDKETQTTGGRVEQDVIQIRSEK